MNLYDALLGKQLGGGGGGGSATLITKNITENGTYSASADDNADGYSSVTVSVPNTYTASDEGKVVDNGALVAQTSSSTTSNGTVDTTTINSLTVNVANSYTQADNGKVVSNQELVAQTAYPSTITTNNTYDTTNYNSVTVNVPVPPTPAESKDVNFYDYDGTIVYSYTAAEFAQLSALPANPTHTGLTSQGWNWTLSDAQDWVATYRILDIGQMYDTNDGNTRFYFDATSDTLNPEFSSFAYSGTTLTVDWGDNTTPDTLTVTSGSYAMLSASHTYASPGLYVISVGGQLSFDQDGNINAASFLSDSVQSRQYRSRIKKIELGSTATNDTSYRKFPTMTGYPDLRIISIPKVETSLSLNDYNFNGSHVKHITFPDNISNLGLNVVASCYNLKSISIAKSTGFDQSVLQKCYNLKRFTGMVASVDSCDTLESATTKTLGGYASFQNCYRLENVYFPSTITSINNRCFENCYYLKEITIPSSVTSIGTSAFYQCNSLQSIEIPSSVTSIGSSCFSYCNNLSTITINKEEDSISGSPWGAPNATVVWTG